MSTGGYDPKSTEAEIARLWAEGGYFDADAPQPAGGGGSPAPAAAFAETAQRDADAPRSYSIMIPPPNVTGALHLGHALNNTCQDILIRRARMSGMVALWMPGTDHAGIATQAIVEKRLKEQENLTRNELGREKLVERIWKWKDEYNERILSQLRRMGISCDWRRTRFTLDDVCGRAVYHAFFEFFRAGLIYRGHRLVNWDTALQTAVADDEIEHVTVRTNLWHIRYPILRHEGTEARRHGGEGKRERNSEGGAGSSGPQPPSAASPAGASPSPDEIRAAIARAAAPDAVLGRDYLAVATTRPETMLADTAVAVHPDDERYQHLIRRTPQGESAGHASYVLLPLMWRAIPVVADDVLVKREFGTGCVKVTPGHDPNDHDCWQRHQGQPDQFAIIDLLTPDGRINANGRGAAPSEPRPPGSGQQASSEPRPQGNGPADHPGGGLSYDYSGMPKDAARKKVVADLEALGLLEKIEPYETEVGHSDRSKAPIEPLRSEQWFMRMGRLAELAMDAVRDGRIRFFPERYAKTYLDWLGEKRDWCISRQLWWGHRIPVWTKRVTLTERNWTTELLSTGIDSLLEGNWTAPSDPMCVEVWCSTSGEKIADAARSLQPITRELEGEYLIRVCYVGKDESVRALLDKAGFEQDPDVLDTWFSSALWPMSTLGWPHGDKGTRNTERGTEKPPGAAPFPVPSSLFPSSRDFDFFFPTDVLCTGRGIITLWVARMAMMALAFDRAGQLTTVAGGAPGRAGGRVPFSQVYIHPIVLDGHGRIMSKSKGNGVDPVDLIETFGADALRFTLAQMATETQDVRMPVAYQCPHCDGLTEQTSVMPKEKFPVEYPKVACSHCKKPFATQWAPDALKQELGVARETSEKFELGRNFVTKLWQAATGYILPQVADIVIPQTPRVIDGVEWHTSNVREEGEIFDRWIRTRLDHCIQETDAALANYDFARAADRLRSFFWNDYCDWYLEETKQRLRDKHEANDCKIVMLQILDVVLSLLHPFMPFVTEAIWQQIGIEIPRHHELIWPDKKEKYPLPEKPPALIVTPWPSPWYPKEDVVAKRDVGDIIQPLIVALRDILVQINTNRAHGKQAAIGKLPCATVRPKNTNLEQMLRSHERTIRLLGRAELEVAIDVEAEKPAECAVRIVPAGEVYVPLAGLMDLDAERKRLRKEFDELGGHLQRVEAKLGNEGFVAKAPAAVIESERKRMEELRVKRADLERNLAEIGG